MNPLTNYAEVFNKNDSKLFIEIPCRGELLEEKDGKIARYHVCYRAE